MALLSHNSDSCKDNNDGIDDGNNNGGSRSSGGGGSGDWGGDGCGGTLGNLPLVNGDYCDDDVPDKTGNVDAPAMAGPGRETMACEEGEGMGNGAMSFAIVISSGSN